MKKVKKKLIKKLIKRSLMFSGSFPTTWGLRSLKPQDSHFVRVLDDTQREKNRSEDKIQEWRKLFQR